jgi:phthiocerol/phenolphthiocerol synthesis type-I polyketide synthase C
VSFSRDENIARVKSINMNSEQQGFKSLNELVCESAAHDPDRLAFTYLEYPGRSGARREIRLTIGQLDQRARALGARLERHVGKGERALLIFRPGIEFVIAFLGCLYAGVIAVPTALPRQGVGAARARAMALNSGARVVLSTSSVKALIDDQLADVRLLDQMLLDEIVEGAPEGWTPTVPEPNDVALLQYSSGSTGEPKGIRISHRNLVHQADLLYSEVGAKPMDCWLAWLPIFHDMGLISAVVTPLAKPLHSVFMAPDSFISRPARWLQALSDFSAVCCASPNFGFELCTRKVSDSDLECIDLSSLRFAVSGAEPIRPGTLERFASRFSAYGFRVSAFYPAYGLAEATLLVTGRGSKLNARAFDSEALEHGRASSIDDGTDASVLLMSSGVPRGGNDVRIVDPETRLEVAAGQVGEIWVSGGSVALGYWGENLQHDESFSGQLVNDEACVFLRTGDLGFMFEGELFVRGRLKDLIIIRGSNHHAPDIEQSVESSDPSLSPSGGAAFSVETGNEERLVIVHELDRESRGLSATRLAAIASAIRRNVSESHQLLPHAIVLIGSGLPKTSSGKVRRQECRAQYLGGMLKVLHQWTHDSVDESVANSATAAAEHRDDLAMRQGIDSEIWLCRLFAEVLGGSRDRFSARSRLKELGLDSDALTRAVREIKREFGLVVAYTIFTEHETIGDLAEFLSDAIAGEDAETHAQGGRLLAEVLTSTQPGIDGANAAEEPVAIVGISCRFPSANGPLEFWKNICDGMDSVGEVPPERWDGEALYDENPLAMGKMNTKRGGFLKDIENFDSRFFGIQTREATRMDPAHRILLELSWELFEDAGLVAENVSGSSVGVYIGISGSDYAQLQFGDEMLSDPYAGIGCALTNSASRISHFHNLRGPALAVDTACSSSLSAMHMGCAAIRSGECEMAIAGGVNIILSPTVSMSLSKAGMMAPDGRCKAFDKSADGYVRSEGAGLVLLKPLSKALADGDAIYAVIRGSATNQDGRSSAISAPNGEAQQRVVLAACVNAGVQPGQLDYVEAHGTGTGIGDPIEVNALGEVLKIGADPGSFCAIGSVKTNIGHCESAAGVASLIKVAMALQSRQIPASLNFNEPNPLIPFDDYRVRVQRELGPFPERERPRLAGVNSFGIGGTNVHFVLEEAAPGRPTAVDGEASSADADQHVLLLSAKSEKSLKAYAGAMAGYLRTNAGLVPLKDICHTLAHRRATLDHRLSVVGSSASELAATLESYQQTGYAADAHYANRLGAAEGKPEIAFVFSGQGSQWWAMGRQLFEQEPVYRREIERCDAQLRPHTGWSLIDVLMAAEQDSLLSETAYAQPAFFALQIAMVSLLNSWGIKPDAVVGHSFGEVAAAHVSGALNLADACRLIAVRARLMQETKGQGRMVSIELARAEVEPLLLAYQGKLSIAASNGPSTTVVSGEHEALDQFLVHVRERGIVVVELGLDYAFHSAQMDRVARIFTDEITGIRPLPPVIPLMSSVTADWSEGTALLGPNYWRDNIRNEVRFRESIEAMTRQGSRIFLEISAHPVLSGAVSRILKAAGAKGSVFSTLERDTDDKRAILRGIASLHSNGLSADWSAVIGQGRFLRGLPQYQWDRQRFWMDAPHLEARIRVSSHPLVSIRMPVAQPTWQSRLDAQSNPFLGGLRTRGEPSLANGLMVELALEAATSRVESGNCSQLCNLQFGAFPLADAEVIPTLQTSLHVNADGKHGISVAAQLDDSQGRAENWKDILVCRMDGIGNAEANLGKMSIESLQARYAQKFSGSETYRKLGEIGNEYPPPVQIASDVWVDGSSALVGLRVIEMLRSDAEKYHLHPLVFEAVEQSCRLAAGSGKALATLRHVRSLRITDSTRHAAYAYCELVDVNGFTGTRDSRDIFRANVWVLDTDGNILAVAEGVSFAARIQRKDEDFSIPDDIDQWRYHVKWNPAALIPAEVDVHPAGGHWLVFADRFGTGEGVAEWLRSRGQACVIVRPGAAYERTAEHDYTISTSSEEHLARLLGEEFVDSGRRLRGVVHLWSLNATPVADTSNESLAADHELGVLSVTDLVRVVSSVELPSPPRLWIVTAGAQSVGANAHPVEISQSLVWGCAKSVVLEHAELRCCRIDLGTRHSADDVEQLCKELWADRIDDQIAFRAGERFIAQLDDQLSSSHSESDDINAEPARPYRVELSEEGHARLKYNRRKSPGSGQVEIEVEIADVADGAGHPSAAARNDLPLVAIECVGRIVRVGPDVVDLKPGQRVIVLESGHLGSHRLVSASALIVLPEGLGSESVVGTARDHVSALFALREIASISRGDRVLVRAGSTASALVVVRMAKWLGARVFVEASSDLHGEIEAIKVAHFFDETNPTAYLDIVAMTEGKGVDVLINCGPHFENSPCAYMLRSFGRCIDMAGNGSSGLMLHATLPSNTSLNAVDIESVIEERAELCRGLLGEVVGRLADGSFKSRGRPILSLVDIDASTPCRNRIVRLPMTAAQSIDTNGGVYRADATYVITGGLGGLGLNIAARMVRDGARNLVLLGRSAPSLAAMDVLAELAECGANCVPMAVDVADRSSLSRVLDQIRSEMPAIRGIIHAAGILDNGLLVQMDHRQVLAVMPAKVDGALNLHTLTDGDELDFFVMFSSLASFIGSPGQSNYAAANAFLESLAEHRRAAGKPGLSIAWGPWADAGMAADVHNLQRLAQHGMGMLSLDKGLDLLEDLIAERVQGAVGALPMNWAAWGRTRGYAAQTPYFSGLVPQQVISKGSHGKLTAAALLGLTPERQLELLQIAILRAVCQSMMLDAENVEMDIPLTAVGLDSIIALELKDRIESSIDVVVRTNALIAGKSIRILAEQFREEMAAAQSAGPLAATASAETNESFSEVEASSESERILETLDELSAEEIEALLLQMSTEEGAA